MKFNETVAKSVSPNGRTEAIAHFQITPPSHFINSLSVNLSLSLCLNSGQNKKWCTSTRVCRAILPFQILFPYFFPRSEDLVP